MIVRIENNKYNLNHPGDAEKFLEDLKTLVFTHGSVTVFKIHGGVWRNMPLRGIE